jgi:hypothetical protein
MRNAIGAYRRAIVGSAPPAARALLITLLIFCGCTTLSAIEIPPSVRVLSADTHKAFAAAFPQTVATRFRAIEENSGGTRLTGEALRVCAELLGYGTAIDQLQGEDNGCFALLRFRWDLRSEGFLLRGPGAYESNSKFLVIVQGRTIVSVLEVASGMGDAGESVAVESMIADVDGSGGLDVLTRTTTTYDKTLGLKDPDTVSYALQLWRHDHFDSRPLVKSDRLAAAFQR